MVKSAIVTGITGQDGAYLAALLLSKGYTVHGIRRRSSWYNEFRIETMLNDPAFRGRLFLHYADLTDFSSIIRVVSSVQPDEIYNLAAQSHVAVSFETPEYTANADGVGALRFLEAIRTLKLNDKTRFYQASTSELYGLVQQVPQTERTPFYPRSPYAVAKLYAYWMTVNYREGFGIFGSNGILFNHESPIRGETFVTRKITRSVALISEGVDTTLTLGNLDAQRDWGHAADFVAGMWSILQHSEADDFVLATGETNTVRTFVEKAFSAADIQIEFSGTGVDEVGHCKKSGRELVRVSEALFRPAEVELLVGDASKAKQMLGWEASRDLNFIVEEMVTEDRKRYRENRLHWNMNGVVS